MKRDLSVLLIEDDEDDYEITLETLEEIPGVSVDLEWIESYEPGMERLSSGGFDICFVDYRIGGRTGLEFIRMARDVGILVPLVLLTGVGQHDIDVAATEAGASDYLDKSELDARTLERTIRYSIAHSDTMKAFAGQAEVLSTTLENAGAGIAALDENGICTARNSRFDGMLDALAGQPGAAADADAAAMLIDRIAEALDSGETGEFEVVGDDGTVHAVSRTRTPSGGAVYVAIDVTQQKAAEQAMLRAREDAEAASRAKSSFFANVSHELRTPLHGIIGFSDLIEGSRDTTAMAEYAREINASGKALLGIINTVIAFSRIESGQQPFSPERIVDLRHFLGDIARPLVNAMSESVPALSIEVDPAADALVMDQAALRTILHNLVENAIRFSDEDATIRVAIDAHEDGGAVLSVRDEGIGIPDAKQERVFDPFYQADDSLARSYEGVGLGLPLVRLLAQAHGADVTLVSAEGEGTTVSVALPPECVVGHTEESDTGDRQFFATKNNDR